MKDNEKVSINTKKKVNVYTFVDGTEHIKYNNIWYDLKSIKQINLEIKPTEKTVYTSIQRSQNAKIASKNSPWRKGLPTKVDQKTMAWAYFNGC